MNNGRINNKLKISGIDWMISFIGWRSRNCSLQKNNFSVVADVSESFCYENFYSKVIRLKKLKMLLSGSVKRVLPDWQPYWYYSAEKGEGITCEKNIRNEIFEINNELHEGVSVKIVYFEKLKKISFTFCHTIFDGVGAEKFINRLFQDEPFDRFIIREIPDDISVMKKSGQELQRVMKKFPEKKILRIPAERSDKKNIFDAIKLAPEEYSHLLENVEHKYGPFSFSIFILATLLCNLEEHIFPAISDKEYIFIPMSIDLRNMHKEVDDEFFNHWSLMPLLISRRVLRDGIDTTIQHLKKLYSDALCSQIPQLFFNAAGAMKYVPYRIVDILVRLQPGKTLGTLMFSFLNSEHCINNEIITLSHFPQMPNGNNLGFFVNLYNNNLNIIISRRPWKDNERFDSFLRNIKIKLHEEVK